MVTNLGLMGASALGSMLNFGGSIFGSMFQNSQSTSSAAKLMLYQYLLQRKLNQNAYQDTTHSMREAGINPMLAIGNGASGGSVGLGSSQSSAPSIDLDLMTAISTAKQLKNDTQRVENETKVSKANVDNLISQTSFNNENALSVKNQNDYWNEYGRDLKLMTDFQNYDNAVKQGELLTTNALDLQNQMFNRNRMTDSNISTNSALALSHRSNANSSNELAREKKIYNDWTQKHPVLYGLGNVKIPQIPFGVYFGKTSKTPTKASQRRR